MANDPSPDWLSDVSELIESTNRIAHIFHINGINAGIQYRLGHRQIIVPKDGLQAIYTQIISILDKINHLLQFDLAYNSPRYLVDLLEIEPTSIPIGTLVINKELLFTPLRRYDDCDNYSQISDGSNSENAEEE